MTKKSISTVFIAIFLWVGGAHGAGEGGAGQSPFAGFCAEDDRACMEAALGVDTRDIDGVVGFLEKVCQGGQGNHPACVLEASVKLDLSVLGARLPISVEEGHYLAKIVCSAHAGDLNLERYSDAKMMLWRIMFDMVRIHGHGEAIKIAEHCEGKGF